MDKEVARPIEVQITLEFICHQLNRLQLQETVPETIDKQDLVNKALDVRSAVAMYLAHCIWHDGIPFGLIGLYSSISV